MQYSQTRLISHLWDCQNCVILTEVDIKGVTIVVQLEVILRRQLRSLLRMNRLGCSLAAGGGGCRLSYLSSLWPTYKDWFVCCCCDCSS